MLESYSVPSMSSLPPASYDLIIGEPAPCARPHLLCSESQGERRPSRSKWSPVNLAHPRRAVNVYAQAGCVVAEGGGWGVEWQ